MFPTTEVREPRGWQELVGRLHACGFSEAAYLAEQDDLRRAGLEPAAALSHFLRRGADEGRFVPCGPFPDGLRALADLRLPNRDYARKLFRAICVGQLRHDDTPGRLWRGVGAPVIGMIREQGGLPYFAIGDSHALHYFRTAWIGDKWLAPMVMPCHGAIAASLADLGGKARFGLNILRWAEAEAKHLDVPILLKFGGIDAEFGWIRHMLRNGMKRSCWLAFETYCQDALTQYGRFLAMLADIAGAEHLWICSAFPSALRDDAWIAGFVDAHSDTPERNRTLAEKLAGLEIPSLAERTAMRKHYNAGLQALCGALGPRFIDDFSPFMGSDGLVGARFLGAHGGSDRHLDISASEGVLVTIIETVFADAGGWRGSEPTG